MTIEREATNELFGLAGSLPRPGWVVLDAARDHRFTGELAFDVLPEVRVYFDRGEIYLAERVTDPSLGSRLVDAGALSAVQLDHGGVRIGDAQHLGRLFERVPSVDRHTVLITAELMNDECVSWVARQNVAGVEAVPYAHHPSGIHRWERPHDAVDLQPGDPLPAPQPTASPIELRPPEPLFDIDASDAMISWDEPSWLDERPPAAAPRQHPTATPASATGHDDFVLSGSLEPSIMSTDWVDRLETEGLPTQGRDPLVAPVELPPVFSEPVDRFEIIWPSGEIDDDFGGVTSVEPERDPDRDRASLTARVTRSAEARQTGDVLADDRVVTAVESPEALLVPAAPADDELGDDVVLAVRRAVASIDTGSITARRRLAETTPEDDQSRGTEQLVLPSRVAVRDVPRSTIATPSRSVFDEPAPVDPVVGSAHVVPLTSTDELDSSDAEPERVSALRRLIGGLRRR